MPIMPGYSQQDYRNALRAFTRAHRGRYLMANEIIAAMSYEKRDSMTSFEQATVDYFSDRRMEKWATLMRITGDLPAEKNAQ